MKLSSLSMMDGLNMVLLSNHKASFRFPNNTSCPYTLLTASFFTLIFLTLSVQDSLSESNNQVNDGVVKRVLSTLDLASELDSPSRYFVYFYLVCLVSVTNCFIAHYPSLHRDETPHLSGSSSVPIIGQNGVSPSSVTVQRHTEPVVDSVASSSTNILNSKPEDLNAPKCC